VLPRRWHQRKNIQNTGLLIADEVQLVGGEVGPTYEVFISRRRYVSAQPEIKTRIVACGVSRECGWVHPLTRSLTSHQGIRLLLLLEGCVLMLLLVPVPSIWIYIFSP